MRAWAIVVCGALACACGSEAEAPSEEVVETGDSRTEQASIENYLATQGFELARVRFDGDEIRVDDDMVFDRRSILALAQTNAEADAAEELAEKGYWHAGSPVAPGSAFCFTFAASVSSSWRDAFRYGAAQWNASGAQCLRLAECEAAGNGGLITISVGDAGTSATGGQAGARATFPTWLRNIGPRVGNSIVIDTSVQGTADTSFQRNTAMHELGHTLGFTHPRNGTFIAGSSSSTTGCGPGGCTASYPTVMDYNYVETTTSSDDRLVARNRYKKYPFGKAGATGCVGAVPR